MGNCSLEVFLIAPKTRWNSLLRTQSVVCTLYKWEKGLLLYSLAFLITILCLYVVTMDANKKGFFAYTCLSIVWFQMLAPYGKQAVFSVPQEMTLARYPNVDVNGDWQ